MAVFRLLAVAAVGLALAAGAVAAQGNEERPNFVIVLCDDLGYGDLGCFGHPHIKSPRLDQLAAEGLKLTDCYASAPVCSPSRCGLLTGRTPSRFRVDDWIADQSAVHLPRSEVTVATLLKRAGYATCHVGKWHCNGKFNSPDQPQPGDHGFEHWFSTQNNALPTHHEPVNFVRDGKAVGPLEGYSSQIIVDEAIGWLRARPAERPFCLFVWFHSPHEIIATPDAFTAPYRNAATPEEEADYFGNIAQMDHETGRLIDTLGALHLDKETLVMFTSDNGPETLRRYQTAERSYGCPGGLRGMKLHLYEGGIRVPGIVRWPGRIQPGSKSAEPVTNLDVLPTLCALAGVTPATGRTLDGQSIVPLLEGRPLERGRPLFWRYDKALGPNKVCLRQGDWKVLADAARSKFELYNLVDDPQEKSDMALQQPERLRELVAELGKFSAEVDADRDDGK